MRTTIAIVIVLLLVLSVAPATAGFLDDIAPDAAILVRPMDGNITGDTYEGVAWEICTDPWANVFQGRDVWLDLITPTDKMGYGVSIDIVPDGAACLGAGWRDNYWLGYIGAHIEIRW